MRRTHARVEEKDVTWCGLRVAEFGFSDRMADEGHAPDCKDCRKKRAQALHGVLP